MSFHGGFSVSSALMTQFKLKIYNCSYRHHYESIVYNGSMIEIIVPANCFIVFHIVFAYCETPYWYIDKGINHTNTRSFFSIVEQDYNIVSEITERILSGQFCCVDECSIYKNNNFGTVTNLYLIIDLPKSKVTKK